MFRRWVYLLVQWRAELSHTHRATTKPSEPRERIYVQERRFQEHVRTFQVIVRPLNGRFTSVCAPTPFETGRRALASAAQNLEQDNQEHKS
jgi:hypothetical protein